MSTVLNKKLNFVYLYCIFLIIALIYIHNIHQNLKEYNSEDKIKDISHQFEIYKKIHKISPKVKYLLLENEDYIDQKELIEEMTKSTPLIINKKQKQINKYHLTLKYISKEENFDSFIENKIKTLKNKSYFIEEFDDYISLFGEVYADGYVYITKYNDNTSFTKESINNSFMIIFIFVLINLVLFLYYMKQITYQREQCSLLMNEFKELEEDTRKIAFEDTLTKAASRLKFEQTLTDLIQIGSRFEQNSFSLVMFDIDYFKRINDTYGHDYGDIVLKSISSIIKKQIRQSDTFARWGGEEFIILLPITGLDEAVTFAQKIRKSISSIKFEQLGQVTCSFGVTELRQDDTNESIMKRVDSLLYDAKNNGRDRVESSKE